MIQLVVTCLLAAGVTFSAPEGWTIDQVGIQGTRNVCSGTSCLSIMVYPIEQSYVRMRRSIAPGARVELPQGCEAAVEISRP